MKSKITAAVLAFLLGGIGVHRFYLNQGGLGLLYLLFCWTFIPFFIAIIDGIVFLVMDDRAFDAKYNYRYSPHPPISNNQAVTVNLGKNSGSNSSSHNSADEIKKLYELKKAGIISPEEFELKKKLLL
jgi:TM2 domain-containing membrane protein YozV